MTNREKLEEIKEVIENKNGGEEKIGEGEKLKGDHLVQEEETENQDYLSLVKVLEKFEEISNNINEETGRIFRSESMEEGTILKIY